MIDKVFIFLGLFLFALFRFSPDIINKQTNKYAQYEDSSLARNAKQHSTKSLYEREAKKWTPPTNHKKSVSDNHNQLMNHFKNNQLILYKIYETDKLINQKLENQTKTLEFLENQEQAKKNIRLGQTILRLNQSGLFSFLN